MTNRSAQERAESVFKILFNRCDLQDKIIQDSILDLFLPLVTKILTSISREDWVRLSPSVVLYVTAFINFYQARKNYIVPDPTQYTKAIRAFIMSTTQSYVDTVNALVGVINDTTKPGNYPEAKRIINTVFVENLVCEVGDRIREYKQTKTVTKRKDIEQRIRILLQEYNEVSGLPPLTFETVELKGDKSNV